MFIRKTSLVIILVNLLLLSLQTSCLTSLRNEQLEKVAKDWALVIRASQVIPVYPLSEDLQPGDVLLISTPIEDQVALYKEKGFLPLDQHLMRLYSQDYREFYNSRYGTGDGDIPPGKWQAIDNEGKHCWGMAPHAAFPTYKFTVDTGAGINLAIPVQGVPFALGLMNSGKASGTVTIAEAYTYGLDNYRLINLLHDWLISNRRLLRNYEPRDGQYHFLRVVSRVYITGKVSVTVNNDEVSGADLAAGADRPVNLIGVKEGSANDNYSKAIDAINALAEKQLPGVKIKIASASSRSISLDETFSKPLVIGYVGFDMPILKGGRVGAPISTLAQLTQSPTLPGSSRDAAVVYRIAALSQMYQALKGIPGEEAARVRTRLDTLEQLLPQNYPFSLYLSISPTEIQKDPEVVAGSNVKGKGFQAVLDYLGNAQSTVETLEGNPGVLNDPQRLQDLEQARAAFKEVCGRSGSEIMEAIDFVFLGE